MRYILIDLENVFETGLIETMQEVLPTDVVYVFYTKNNGKLRPNSLSLKSTLKADWSSSLPPRIAFIECPDGDQVLDKCLISHLGRVLNHTDDFIIISKDKGYEKVIEYYKANFGYSNIWRSNTLFQAEQYINPAFSNTSQPIFSLFEDIPTPTTATTKTPTEPPLSGLSAAQMLTQPPIESKQSATPPKPEPSTPPQSTNTKLNNELQVVLYDKKNKAARELSKSKRLDVNKMISYIIKNRPKTEHSILLLEVYRRLAKIFKKKEGTRIYHLVKEILEKYKDVK